MAITRIMPQAGIVKDNAEYASEGVWTTADKVRFHLGYPQKLGGYAHVVDASFSGVARSLIAWNDFNGDRYIGIGTHTKYWVENGGIYLDKTPIRASASSTLNWLQYHSDFSTSLVRCIVTGHGATIGDRVHFTSGETTISAGAGSSQFIIASGTEYEIVSVSGANKFYIPSGSTATAATTASGGAAEIRINFELTQGNAQTFQGLGFGAGEWGSASTGPLGSATGASAGREWGEGVAATVGPAARPRFWSHAVAGQDLIANPAGGGIYFLDLGSTDTEFTGGNRLRTLANAPTSVEFVFITDDRHVVALGGPDSGGTANLMHVEWSDQENFETWTAAATNTAGDHVLQGGSKLIAGTPIRGGNFLWSNTHCFEMRFTGPPFTFGFKRIGEGGLIGQNAWATWQGDVWWMGKENFYYWSGGDVQIIPCPIRDFVFDNLNTDQQNKIACHVNAKFQEVWWDYPTLTGGDENSAYVSYNWRENHWNIGTYARTAVSPNSKDFTILATHTDNRLHQHDQVGVYDADGSIMRSFIRSAPMDIGDGDRIAIVNTLIPDAEVSGGTLFFTVKSRRYPQATEITRASGKPFTSSTRKFDIRAAGRQLTIAAESSGTSNVNWRLSDLRADVKEGGRR